MKSMQKKNVVKKCYEAKDLYLLSLFKNGVKWNGWSKLKQEVLWLDTIQIDALAMGMVQHWNRVSKDILESLFQILKMGQTDICQWCETDVLLKALLLLNFYSNSSTSVKRKTHINRIACMPIQTCISPQTPTLPLKTPLKIYVHFSHSLLLSFSPVFALKQGEKSLVIP